MHTSNQSDPQVPGSVADATSGNWVDTTAPIALRPYLRLARADRPIGAWLLLWPCWWGSALAAIAAEAPYPNPWHLLLFLVGAFVMRAAGCIYNDLVDHDIDAQVDRTRSRPLPSGQVTRRQAQLLMVCLSLIGLLVLLQFNATTILVGVMSLLIVAIYPFMKRVTNWPQSVLGLAFAWGALVSWSAVFGTITAPALTLYATCVAWIVAYDTIYAHQDTEDDALIGLGSTALRFGDRTKPWLVLFFSITLGGLTAAGWQVEAGWPYFAGVILAAAHVIWQITTLNTQDGANCLARFRANNHIGWIVFVGLCADAALR